MTGSSAPDEYLPAGEAASPAAGSDHASDAPAGPPPWLPRHPEFFWSPTPGLDRESLTVDADARSALETLGAPPFEKSGFPLIGLLATIYDHVAEHAAS